MTSDKTKSVRRWSPSGGDLIFLAILFLGTATKMNYVLNRITGNYRLYVNIFRTLNLALLIFGFGSLILNLRAGRFILTIISVCITAGFFTFLFYLRYFGTIVSYGDVSRAGNLPPVIGAVFRQLARPADLLFLLYPLVLLALAIRGVWLKLSPRRVRRWIYAAAGILAIFFQTGQILAFNVVFHKNFAIVKGVGNSSFINCYGVTFYGIYDVYHHYRILQQRATLNPKRPQYGYAKADSNYPIPHLLKGANVILLQVESLDNAILFRSHNGVEVTPHLNNLARENIYYERYFAQHNTGTVDADYALITSNYAGSHYTAFTFCDMSRFTSLPRVLKKHGYFTSAMHANRATFYNRLAAFKTLGFDVFYSQKDYPPPQKGEWALDDFTFLKDSAKRIIEQKQPFFTYLITITSHTPFDFPTREKSPPAFDDIQPTIGRDYIRSIHFVDSAIGNFLEILRKANTLNNTIVVIVGDHTSKLHHPPIYSALNYITESVSAISEYPEHIPLIIIYPEKNSARVSKYCYPGDVPPTIMDLLGFHNDPTPWMGHSLYSQEVSPIFIRGRDIIFLKDGYLFRGGARGFTMWKKTKWASPAPPTLTKAYSDYVLALAEYSDNILFKNYK